MDGTEDHEAGPDVATAARALLGRTLVGHDVSVRITEVEAYGGSADPASHAFRRTPRSEIMFGPPWRLYVYRSYGIHHCANVVTGPTEQGAAVLIRAGEVIAGHEIARSRRATPPGTSDLRLARGPGNLAQALGITVDDKGRDLRDPAGPVRLDPAAEAVASAEISAGPRVGVSAAADVPWRFWLTGHPTVSAYRRSPRAPRPR